MTDADRPRGRPRDSRCEAAILDATIALVGEVGFAGLTVDAVASRAAVGKATIYRRWTSKEELVLAAMRCIADDTPTADTGTLRGDLLALWTSVAETITRSDRGGLLAALVAEAGTNCELRAVLSHFVDERRSRGRAVFERARSRGEVAADLDVELAVDLVSAPIFYRRLISGAPIGPGEGERLLALLLDGVAPANRSGARCPAPVADASS